MTTLQDQEDLIYSLYILVISYRIFSIDCTEQLWIHLEDQIQFEGFPNTRWVSIEY